MRLSPKEKLVLECLHDSTTSETARYFFDKSLSPVAEKLYFKGVLHRRFDMIFHRYWIRQENEPRRPIIEYITAVTTDKLPNGKNCYAAVIEGPFNMPKLRAALLKLGKRLKFNFGVPFVSSDEHYNAQGAYCFVLCHQKNGSYEFVPADNRCFDILHPDHQFYQQYVGFATAVYEVGDETRTQVLTIPPFTMEKMGEDTLIDCARKALHYTNSHEPVHGLQKIEIFKVARRPCATYTPGPKDTYENPDDMADE